MRRQDGGVPSQRRSSMGSATGGGHAARWEFHFLVGGQDTQDTHDTHDGGRVGLRSSERLSGQEMACELTHQAGAVLGVLGVLGVLAKALEREAAKCLSGHWPAANTRRWARLF